MRIYPHVLAITIGLLTGAAPALAAPQKARTIRWFVAHDRGDTPFTAIIKDFARSVEAKSDGALKVEFVASGAPEAQLDEAAFQQIAEGRADMAQIPAWSAGVGIFEMPFLFRSYEHAELVFEGPIGKKLVADIATASKNRVRGFAFTYSGGYRILVGRVPVRRIADFKALRMRKDSGLTDLMKEWGVSPIDADPANAERPIAQIGSGRIDLEETEVNRLALTRTEHPDVLKNVEFANLTRHRMYVTALVANEKFFASLPDKLRELLSTEIEALAVAERKLSIGLERSNLEFLAKSGMKLVELPEAERAAFIKSGEAVHKKYPGLSVLIRDIREAKALSGS